MGVELDGEEAGVEDAVVFSPGFGFGAIVSGGFVFCGDSGDWAVGVVLGVLAPGVERDCATLAIAPRSTKEKRRIQRLVIWLLKRKLHSQNIGCESNGFDASNAFKRFADACLKPHKF